MRFLLKFHAKAFILCFLPLSIFAKSPELIFALDVIRHGDRTSLRELPSMPHQWEEGHGQLTAKGMRQTYELGTKLRKKYIEETKLLSEFYQAHSLYVRSTDLDRTLMSAQSVLFGLYPLGTGPKLLKHEATDALPAAYQPIPIHTMHQSDKDVLLVDTHLPLFSQNFEQHVKTAPEWVQKHNQLKPNYARWSKATGVNITELRQLVSLGNILYVYQENGIALPDALSKEDIAQIVDAGHWAFCYMFKPKPVGKAMGSPLLEHILDNLSKASAQNQLKLMLLSGHDSSLLALLSALEVPLDEPPPYASHVNFSVYQSKDAQPYVVISYNDKILKPPVCGGEQCGLEQLKSLSL